MKSAAFDEERQELLFGEVVALFKDYLGDCRKAGKFLLFEYEL
jgi:hypothetical protein